jgi:hypothetical protein
MRLQAVPKAEMRPLIGIEFKSLRCVLIAGRSQIAQLAY